METIQQMTDESWEGMRSVAPDAGKMKWEKCDTKAVCHICGADWGNDSSPRTCDVCNQHSAMLYVARIGGGNDESVSCNGRNAGSEIE